jgi:hypothetical protein
MSENTVFLITERGDGLFTVSRHDLDAMLSELDSYRRDGLTLRQATDYCDSEHAEYGYQIMWREEEEAPTDG